MKGGALLLSRLPHFTSDGGTFYKIGHREVEAREERDVRVSIAAIPAGTPWWEVKLPPCPDCSGLLTWHEAGLVPGARRCVACGSIFTVRTFSAEVEP